MDRLELHRKLKKIRLNVYYDAFAGVAHSSCELRRRESVDRVLAQLAEAKLDVVAHTVTQTRAGTFRLVATVAAKGVTA